MDDTDSSRIRKRLMSGQVSMTGESAGEIDIARHAALAYWSEDPNHPLEHLIDSHYGPGATRWASARPNTTEYIVFEFDRVQRISRLIYEWRSVGSSAHRRCAWKSGRIETALTGRC
jgi:hypothetical protein